ncbi:S8 family serine peptidase [Oceanibium sediminis]|uniref:S8 family serine peptidase n=1 Tax=Oceanibium sediminis TaxID=2026339 RepID=UPI000DD37B5D|nr:S8 family serine peptidase [Oceanibium sediminis]
MARPTQTKGWKVVETSPNADAAADWSFFADPARKPESRGALRPVLVQVKSGKIDTLEQRIAAFAQEQGPRKPGPKVKVPKAYRANPGRERGRDPVTRGGDTLYSVLADEALFELMRQQSGSGDPEHPRNDLFLAAHGPILPEDSLGDETQRDPVQLPNTAPAEGVVVTAVIDTGLPFLNDCFRSQNGAPRVRYAWVQDGLFRNAPPSFVPFGREFEAADIADLFARYTTAGIMDELAAYREAGLADFGRPRSHALGRRVTHGAHVASLAGGYPRAEDRTDNPLIFVQLPNLVAADTSGASLAPYLLSALDYIVDRADRIADDLGCGQLPLAINFSFGGTGGPLDGTSAVEERMDALLKARNKGKQKGKTTIVLPAGNAHQSRGHAKMKQGEAFQGPNPSQTLTWRIQPDDHTASFVEIWTPNCTKNDQLIEVVLHAPQGLAVSPAVQQGADASFELVLDSQTIAKISYTYVPAPTRRGKFTLTVAATGRSGGTHDLAPSGRWKIEVRDVGLPTGSHVDAWVLRDDELPGFDTDARQSRFEDPAYKRWTPEGFPEQEDNGHSIVVRAGLQNVIGTGTEPVVVGGYIDRSGALPAYTAGGPTNTANRPGPDAVTVADDSKVHRGVVGSAVLSGGKVTLGGTSVAAPQVTRALAGVLATGGKADRAEVAAMAQADDPARFPNRAPTPGAARGGEGRLQLSPQAARRYRPFG